LNLNLSTHIDEIMFLPINLKCRNVMTKTEVKQEGALNVSKEPRLSDDFYWLNVKRV
jgi:hypothetical protein